MYKDNKVLGLVPARGGSKGLTGKNLIKLCDKPLIAWTFCSAFESKYIDSIVVSTDDPKIADVSRKHGVLVPFMRPDNLASDTSSVYDVILHALNEVNRNDEYQILVLLQPTAPLRISEDIDNSVESLFEKDADSIISVCEAEHIPKWMNTLPPDLSMINFISKKDQSNTNRQNFPRYYRLNGAVYVSFVKSMIEFKSFYQNHTFAYIMPKERSIDIDDEIDLVLAEILMRKNISSFCNSNSNK